MMIESSSRALFVLLPVAMAMPLLLSFILPHSVDAFSSSSASGRPLVSQQQQQQQQQQQITTSSSSQHIRGTQFSSTLQSCHPSLVTSLSSSSSSSADASDDSNDTALSKKEYSNNKQLGVDKIFTTIDIDGSGTIDLSEYDLVLSSNTQYSAADIQRSFHEIDTDGNGEISRDEFQTAIANTDISIDSDCPMGYWLNSVEKTCQPLGPVGRISQKIETSLPFKDVYKRITNLFGVNKLAMRKHGVSFALAYSIISNLNGALSLSVAWYMTVKRVSIILFWNTYASDAVYAWQVPNVVHMHVYARLLI